MSVPAVRQILSDHHTTVKYWEVLPVYTVHRSGRALDYVLLIGIVDVRVHILQATLRERRWSHAAGLIQTIISNLFPPCHLCKYRTISSLSALNSASCVSSPYCIPSFAFCFLLKSRTKEPRGNMFQHRRHVNQEHARYTRDGKCGEDLLG